MTQFYIVTPDTYPRQYHAIPVEQPIGKFETKYKLAPQPFVVHSKCGGDYKKPQPFVVRGMHRDELLVQKIGDVLPEGFDARVTGSDAAGRERWRKHYSDGAWRTLRFDETTEGYRFVRTVRKAIELLAKLAREGQKDRAKIAKATKDLAERGVRCGICPCCFGDYIADKSTGAKMVHHGYERPGDGMIHGDCYGVGYAPFEVSCEGTKFYRGIVQNALLSYQATLAVLPTLEVVKVESGSTFRNGRFWPEYKEIKRGEYGFDREIESRCYKLEGQIASATRHLTDLDQKIATWKPVTFPHVQKKAKTSNARAQVALKR